jgi:putative ABC transport system permease protein
VIRLSGRLRSALIIGGQGIRARKLRTLLSMVSVFMGVLAVVLVQAAAETARDARLADLELNAGVDGTRQMYLPPGQSTVDVVRDTLRGKADAIAISTTQAIIGEPGVTPVNPGAMPFDQVGGGPAFAPPAGGMTVSCDPSGNCFKIPLDGGGVAAPPPSGQAIEVMLVALTGDIRPFRPFRPVGGEWLDFSSPPSLSPRLVVNMEAAKGFQRFVVPAEMRVSGAIADPTPRIVGVVHDGSPQPTAYVRADELENWLPTGSENGGGQGVQVLMAPSAAETEQILRARLVATGIDQGFLGVQTIEARKEIEKELQLTRLIFLGLAGLVLLIGAAGILNVGLATVGERVEEFALRRAVGTPRSLLAGIVLAETLLTGVLTAAAAIGVAVLAIKVGGNALGSRLPFIGGVDFPWQAAVAGIIAGLVAGLLGGLIPAIRAARIPIATVMRA